MDASLDVQTASRAHLPEAEAYRRFLGGMIDASSVPGCRVTVKFMGFAARWSERGEPGSVLVADYPSASTGRLRSARDWAKRHVGQRPDVAVFCGPYVQHRVAPPGVRSVQREMGYFAESILPTKAHEYDVVYAGTAQRPGVVDALQRLSSLGLSVVVASSDRLPDMAGVTHIGRLGIDDLYELYSRCALGLNVVPSIAPFAYQASTKVIEYCAAGLGVITTGSPWIDAFERERGGRFLRLDEVRNASEVRAFGYRAADVSGLDWGTILRESGLPAAIEEAYQERQSRRVAR